MKKSIKWALIIGSAVGILAVIGRHAGDVPASPEEWKARNIDPRGAAFAQLVLEQDLLTHLDGGTASDFWKARVPLGERVSARQYHSIYRANEVSADEQFNGKPVVVTGTIDSINKDAFGNAFLNLTAGGAFSVVRANLASETEALAGNFRKGAKVTLFCTGGPMVITFPTLKDCQTSAAMITTHDREAAKAVQSVMKGDAASMSPNDRKMIAMMYLVGATLPPDSPCANATPANFGDCEKSFSKNNPLKNPEVVGKYEDLRKTLDLPPLKKEADG